MPSYAGQCSQDTTARVLDGLRTRNGAVRTDDQVTASERSDSRAFDGYRERVLEILKTAFVQGRLTKDELDTRAGKALRARTVADLTALTADIPAWSIPRPVRESAKRPARSVHALVGAIACAIIALAAITTARLPDTMAMPAPPHWRSGACYAIYAWIGSSPNALQDRDVATLTRAVTDARHTTDRALTRDLQNLRQAARRYDAASVPPVAVGPRHVDANHVGRDTHQVISDCEGGLS